jgi:hypothetical protein
MTEKGKIWITRMTAVLLLISMYMVGRETAVYVMGRNVVKGASKERCVVIDAGHGGIDPGKIGVNHMAEKDINLSIALILRDMLTANGWTAIQLVMLATALAFALGYLLSRRVSLRKVCFAVAVIAALICLLSTALALSSRSAAEKHETAVVVCSDTTPVHASPDSASKIIRQPSQGVTIGIVREHDGWTEISFADGEKGWIRTNLIETV